MPKVLIDTHALLWYLKGDEQLSALARSVMDDEATDRYVSHASVWEVCVKLGSGKLRLPAEPREFFITALAEAGAVMLPLEVEDFYRVAVLPRHH